MRFAAALGLGLSLAATAIARSEPRPREPPPATRADVEAKLRAHPPPPAASFRALGYGTDQLLVEIGGDAKAELLLRARAIAALGYLPTAPSRRFLEAFVAEHAGASDDRYRLLLRRAAVALGWQGGLHAASRLGALFDHHDPDVRLDAALGLGLTRLPAAADLLRKRLPNETEARVRSQISKQLRLIEDALAAGTAPGTGRP